ncbi:hypothetical protein GEMRC1_012286 [Eukaryota sp. GEM-RC1]
MADRYSDDLYLQIEEFEREKRRIDRQLYEEKERQKLLQSELSSAEEQLKVATDRQAELQTLNHDLEATINTMRDEHVQLKAELKKLKIQATYLLEQAELEKANAKEQKRTFSKQLLEINSKLSEYHSFYTNQSLSKEVQRLEEENCQLKTQLNDVNGSSEVSSEVAKLNMLKEENELLKRRMTKRTKKQMY